MAFAKNFNHSSSTNISFLLQCIRQLLHFVPCAEESINIRYPTQEETALEKLKSVPVKTLESP